MAKSKANKTNPKPVATDSPYLTIREFAQRLRISPATAFRHLPRLRTIRFGGRTLIRVEDADAYATSLIREPAGSPKRAIRGRRPDQRASA